MGEGGGGCVCSLANYSVAYEETQSNRVSDFRDFCVVFVPKGNPFRLLFYHNFIYIFLLQLLLRNNHAL